MSFAHVARTALAGTLAICFYVAAGTAATAQDAAGPPPLKLASGVVSILGTSNVHEYTASTDQVRITRLQLGAGLSTPSFWDDLLKPGAVEAFEIAIPAASLTSPKEGLDKNMHKALKVKEFVDITFRLVRLEPGVGGALKAIGMLKIAGVEREVAMAIKTQRSDTGLLVKGQLDLLMTDYGITPPKAMLGMLKTDPKVTVTFETVLTVPLT